MRWNTWLSVLALGLALAPAWSTEVAVTLPSNDLCVARLEDQKTGTVLSGPVNSKGSSVRLDVGDTPSPGTWVFVVENTATGNVAVKPVPKGSVKPVVLTADSFNRISRVEIQVTDRQGGVPSRAAVSLKDGKGEVHWASVSPEDKGKAVFRNIPAGDGEVRVQQGVPSNYQGISFRLPLKREKPVLEFTADVTLPDGMDTLNGKTATSDGTAKDESSGKESPKEERTPAPRGGFANFLGVILGFAILACALWFGYRALKKRGVTAIDALKAAGINLPDDAPPPQPLVPAEPQPQVDPNTCPYCGRQKDPVTGVCTCTFTPPAASARPVSPSGLGARITVDSGAQQGRTIPLTGALTIGRDPGQDLALTDDSAASRRHAVITRGPTGALIEDQGSSNGTFVNGRRIQSQEIKNGDSIVIGATKMTYLDS